MSIIALNTSKEHTFHDIHGMYYPKLQDKNNNNNQIDEIREMLVSQRNQNMEHYNNDIDEYTLTMQIIIKLIDFIKHKNINKIKKVLEYINDIK